MRFLLKLFLALFLESMIGAGLVVQAQAAMPQVCTKDEARHALDEADILKDWGSVYCSFKKFALCDDGAIGEGYSDTIGRLLSQDWQHVDSLFRLVASDQAFERFVLRHLDETLNSDTLKAIADNASVNCPHGQNRLCALIEAQSKVSAPASDSLNCVKLGFLEDLPGHFYGQPDFRAVRAAFRKAGDDWLPFRSACRDEGCLKTLVLDYPAEVIWTISLRGKTLGQVTARTPKDFKFSSDVGLQKIIGTTPVPTVGEKSGEYSGFLGVPVYRPLVAASQPIIKDSEGWKPLSVSAKFAAILRRQFRQRFPAVSNCRNADENIEQPWNYRDEDITVEKAYSSNKNWFVASLHLTTWRCDGPVEDGGAFDVHWYVISPSKVIKSLGAGMWLVDAGDYANDGKTEVVFAIDRYDAGGYELFYDDFRKHAVFEFGYH